MFYLQLGLLKIKNEKYFLVYLSSVSVFNGGSLYKITDFPYINNYGKYKLEIEELHFKL